MIKKVLIGGASVLMFACNNESANNAEKKEDSITTTANTSILTDEEKKDGWQVLFDGSSIQGWHIYGGVPVGDLWKIQDGTLFFDAGLKKTEGITEDRNLVTDADYENFDLKLEWKIDTAGNSGIMFYVNEDTMKYKKPYETGPEMQVLDNEKHPDAKIIKHRAGDLYDLISCSKETVKPALEWNQAEVKCVNGKLDLYLNGENVVSTTLWDDNWKKMVAGSKFKDMPGFGTFKKGKICLQDHGNNVWYRNIKIKAL